MEWRFSPLQVTHWAADAAGNSHVVDAANESFMRRFDFWFECHAGKPRVSVGGVGAP